VAVAGDLGLRSAGQPETYSDLLDGIGVLGQLLWTGGYPVIGWAGFVLVGAWVVRLPLGNTRTQWALLAGAGAVAATQPFLAAASKAFDGSTFLDSAAHSNQTAWYLLAAASAVAVLAGSLLLGGAVRALVPLGQMALSGYLAHLLVGEAVVFPWLDTSSPSLVVQMTVAAAVFAGLAVAARAWLLHHRRGPVETAVRALAT